jgi:hypothetical protein
MYLDTTDSSRINQEASLTTQESSLETIGTTRADRRQRASIDSIDRPRRGEEHV